MFNALITIFLVNSTIYPDYNTLITDELLRLVTPVIPISEWRRIAYEAFNLTVNEVDAIESTPIRSDVIFHLLHQAVQRDQMPAKVLKQKIEDARAGGVKIGHNELANSTTVDSKINVICKIFKQIDLYNFIISKTN